MPAGERPVLLGPCAGCTWNSVTPRWRENMEIEAFHPEKGPVPRGTALPRVGGKIWELRLFTQKKSLWPPAAEAPGAGAACFACTRSDPDFLGPSQGFFWVLPKDPLGSFPVRPPRSRGAATAAPSHPCAPGTPRLRIPSCALLAAASVSPLYPSHRGPIPTQGPPLFPPPVPSSSQAGLC